MPHAMLSFACFTVPSIFLLCLRMKVMPESSVSAWCVLACTCTMPVCISIFSLCFYVKAMPMPWATEHGAMHAVYMATHTHMLCLFCRHIVIEETHAYTLII